MKKLIIALVLVLISSVAWSQETMVTVDKGSYAIDGSLLRTITLLCTTDTDGSFTYQLTEDQFHFIKGWLIIEVRVSNSTAQTDPTANSDLYFRLEAGGSFDLLHAAGVDEVDNDVVNSIRPNSSADQRFVVFGVDRFHIEVANNVVDSAVFNVILILYPAN